MPGALRRRRRRGGLAAAVGGRSRPRQSPARVDVVQVVHDVADLADALDERRLALHLLRRTVGGGTAISRRIVPGADEKT